MTLATACTHHWQIGAPNGSTVKGKCRRCREEREFVSAFDDAPTKNNSSSKECSKCHVRKRRIQGTFRYDGKLKRWADECSKCEGLR